VDDQQLGLQTGSWLLALLATRLAVDCSGVVLTPRHRGGWGTMDNGTRDQLLGRLAEAIESVTTAHPVRVAVDGRPAAGKSMLADELALVLRNRGREVIRASIESFLLPRAQRYRRGQDSPEGCYHDSFDFDALHRVLLDPLGRDGDRRFQQAVYDRDTDTALSPRVTTAAADAVLLFDGVFLLRPELIDQWDLRIFVTAAFEETLARARVRDLASLGSAARVEQRFRNRYLPSQEHYFDTVRPTDLADIVVHNDEPEQPAWEVAAAGPGPAAARRSS
jgi:uridine kinase